MLRYLFHLLYAGHIVLAGTPYTLVSCLASFNKQGKHCNEARDGKKDAGGNGWTGGPAGLDSPAWAQFTLERPATVNTIAIQSGRGKVNKRITKMKLEIQYSSGVLSIPEELHIVWPKSAEIANGGIISVSGQQEWMKMRLKPTEDVTAVKLSIFETRNDENTAIVNEIYVTCKFRILIETNCLCY